MREKLERAARWQLRCGRPGGFARDHAAETLRSPSGLNGYGADSMWGGVVQYVEYAISWSGR